MTNEQWILPMLKKYGPSTPLSIVICKPSHINGSIWQGIESLKKSGQIESAPNEKKAWPQESNLLTISATPI